MFQEKIANGFSNLNGVVTKDLEELKAGKFMKSGKKQQSLPISFNDRIHSNIKLKLRVYIKLQ